MQRKNKFITTQLKSKYQCNLNFHMPMGSRLGERDWRVTALHDLDLATEDLNCNNNLILFRHIWKNLASYMRRHSVNENPTVNKSYTYTYTKAVYIDSLNQYHNHINNHIGKPCICLFLLQFGKVR